MRPVFLLSLLVGCGIPSGGWYDAGALWNPADTLAASDGVYAPLTQQGEVAFVRTDATWGIVHTDGVFRDLALLPDGSGVIGFVDRVWCDDEDVEAGDPLSDCAFADRNTESQLVVLEGGALTTAIDVPTHLNALSFGPTGFAIAYLDAAKPTEIQGVVNLTEVEVVDLDNGTTMPVRVGFAADRVLFTDDGAQAVVLSQSAVAVVDLTASPPVTDVTFPLTLDPDQLVDPVGVDLTPDGSYALISVQGSGDLYVLDLVNPSVNIVTLQAAPADMYVDAGADATALVSASSATLEIIDHALFDKEVVPLDEPMDRILAGDDFLLLHGARGQKDVYRYVWETGELIEYRLQNPPIDVQLAPGGQFAVALTRTESATTSGTDGFYDGRPGMEILDLRLDADDTIPYALDGVGVGLAFVPGEGDQVWALVLQDGADYLWKGELSTGIADTVDLVAPPVAIGEVPGGGMYVTHDVGLGLVTLYDPATDATELASGFAVSDIFESPTLVEAP